MGLRMRAAYLFERSEDGTIEYLSKVSAPDKASSDWFGRSISSYGDYFFVGAHGSDPDGFSSAGAVYIFRVESNSSASYVSKLSSPDPGADDWFGYAISAYGNHVCRCSQFRFV